MDSFFSWLFFLLLLMLIVRTLYSSFRTRDYSQFWSPLTIFSAVFLYYCIIPFLDSSGWMYMTGDHSRGLFMFTAFLNYLCILFGFKKSNISSSFSRWNNLFSEKNSFTIGVILFSIGICGFGIARGFNFSLYSTGEELEFEFTGLSGWLANFISSTLIALCLLYVKKEFKFKYIAIIATLFLLVAFIQAGGRHRIVCLILTLATFGHLFPSPKKVKVIPLLIISLVAYFGFAIMEFSRTASGINKEALSEISSSQVTKGSAENKTLFEFSMMATNYYSKPEVEHEYLAPVLTAVFFPLPRAIFPWKTFSNYGTELKYKLVGVDSGSAWLSFTDAFIAFGLLGVIINGLFAGWIASFFWHNYRNNVGSIGALVLLAVFNAWVYEFVSRGYLAGNYSNFIFMICLPMWMVQLLKKIFFK